MMKSKRYKYYRHLGYSHKEAAHHYEMDLLYIKECMVLALGGKLPISPDNHISAADVQEICKLK